MTATNALRCRALLVTAPASSQGSTINAALLPACGSKHTNTGAPRGAVPRSQ
jgi:hypothetical protein